MADRLSVVSAFFLLAVAASGAGAQSAGVPLADPTKPPSTFTNPTLAAAELSIGPVLQSVVIPAKGRPIAVIGGEEVRLGGMYDGRRLTRLTEREAVLEGPDGVEHLPLTPGIEKTNITPRVTSRLTRASAAAKRAPRGNKP